LQVVAPYPSQPLIRPVIGDTALIKQLLDIGAQTLLVPVVESASQARELAHHAGRFHAHQHAGHARLEDAGQFRQLVNLQLTVTLQDADDPPLLFGQAVFIQGRAENTHGCFAGLQQGQGLPGFEHRSQGHDVFS
jgi:2-keto-3-deoxy-L-rhamnonate aldolase RhmA